MRRLQRTRPERTKRVKISRQARELDQIFTPSPDQNAMNGIEYTDSLEADAAAEVDALADTFAGRAKIEAKRFELATDSEFWFAVYFKDREQKEAFLKALDWFMEGDKYLNGLALAEIMDIDLPEVDLPKPKNISKRMKRLARDLS